MAFRTGVLLIGDMTRSPSLVGRPILRLLLLALMGLALASRLALGATLPVVNADNAAVAADPVAKLQAAMIMCGAGHGHKPAPDTPPGPSAGDLLLFGQADNAHALAAGTAPVSPVGFAWAAPGYLAAHATGRPPLWPPVGPARGPPAAL